MNPRRSPGPPPAAPRGRDPLPEPPPSSDRPPDPPGELTPDCHEVRAFALDDVEWQARLSGKSAGGTGGYGLALLEAVHFSRADEPAVPRYEALLPRGRFAGLFDEELRELLRRAVPIRLPDRGDTAR